MEFWHLSPTLKVSPLFFVFVEMTWVVLKTEGRSSLRCWDRAHERLDCLVPVYPTDHGLIKLVLCQFGHITSISSLCISNGRHLFPNILTSFVPWILLQLGLLLPLELNSGLLSDEESIGNALEEELGGEVLADHEDEEVDSGVEASDVAEVVQNLCWWSFTHCFEDVLGDRELVEDLVGDHAELVEICVFLDVGFVFVELYFLEAETITVILWFFFIALSTFTKCMLDVFAVEFLDFLF